MSFSDEEVERYARHLVLREIGGPGQQKLKSASVLIVGVGGLGAPASLYLAAAGIGRLGLADPDHVSLSNLQRQIIYATSDMETPKVKAAAAHLASLNPHVVIETHAEPVTGQNAGRILAPYDLVLDGTDDFAARFIVNEACLALGKPLVSGAIGRWTGQVGAFCQPNGPCYRCLTPEIPPDAETCQRVGVMGALAGVIGSMMALEAIKLVTGLKPDLTGRLLIYDALGAEARTVRLHKDPACPACAGAH